MVVEGMLTIIITMIDMRIITTTTIIMMEEEEEEESIRMEMDMKEKEM
jgi:hypothetical protein